MQKNLQLIHQGDRTHINKNPKKIIKKSKDMLIKIKIGAQDNQKETDMKMMMIDLTA